MLCMELERGNVKKALRKTPSIPKPSKEVGNAPSIPKPSKAVGKIIIF